VPSLQSIIKAPSPGTTTSWFPLFDETYCPKRSRTDLHRWGRRAVALGVAALLLCFRTTGVVRVLYTTASLVRLYRGIVAESLARR